MRTVCQKGIVLDRGRVTEQGEINKVADHYLEDIQPNLLSNEAETASFIVEEIFIESEEGSVIKTFDNVKIRVKAKAKTDIVDPGLYVGLLTRDNQRIAALDLKDFQTVPGVTSGDSFELGFDISALPILPGSYELEVFLKDLGHHKIELVPRRVGFDVVESPVYGGRKIDSWYGQVGLRARGFAQGASLTSSDR
ncbi:MAG: Wzt carbohydrate-binding domain-containing protein [Candidatus Sulfotelmatobacter sp.]